jgi:hypothetical protein
MSWHSRGISYVCVEKLNVTLRSARPVVKLKTNEKRSTGKTERETLWGASGEATFIIPTNIPTAILAGNLAQLYETVEMAWLETLTNRPG